MLGTTFPIARTGVAVVAAVAGVLLIWLAAPRVIAAFHTAPYGSGPSAVPSGSSVDAAQLDAAATSFREALSWSDDPATWSQLGFVFAYRAELSDASEDVRADFLTRAALATTEALIRAPAEPSEWMRLALLRAKLSRPMDEVAAALKMSFYTGPNVPELAIPRLRMAFVVWDRLDAEAVGLVRSEIRFSWKLPQYDVWRFGDVRTRLIAAALETGALDRVRTAMNQDPVQRLEFERALLEHFRQ